MCLSSFHLKLSTDGCSLFGVQSFEGYLEEHGGGGGLVKCSCSGDFAYLILCVPLTVHILFSCSSTRIISGVEIRLRKMYVLSSLGCLFTWSKIFMSLLERGSATTLWELWSREHVLNNFKNSSSHKVESLDCILNVV